MASGKNFAQTYGQAEKAYMQGNYEEAATIIDDLVKEFPQDPNAALLRGHIYCYGLQQYDVAKAQYEAVLELGADEEFIEYAQSGIEHAAAAANSSWDSTSSSANLQEYPDNFALGEENSGQDPFSNFSEYEDTNFISSPTALGDSPFDQFSDEEFPEDPFSFSASEQETFGMPESSRDELFANYQEPVANLEDIPSFSNHDLREEAELMELGGENENYQAAPRGSNTFRGGLDSYGSNGRNGVLGNSHELDEPLGSFDDFPEVEEETLLMSGEDFDGNFNNYSANYPPSREELDPIDSGAAFGQGADPFSTGRGNGYRSMDKGNFGMEDISGGLPSEPMTSDFLEEFDVFGADDDLSAISNFNLDDQDTLSSEPGSMSFGYVSSGGSRTSGFSDQDLSSGSKAGSEEEIFSLSSDEQLPSFALEPGNSESPVVMVDQGLLAPMENAPLQKKQLFVAAATGIVSAVAVAIVSFGAASTAPAQGKEVVVPHLRITGGIMTLAAGVASFGTAWFFGRISTRQIKRSTDNLQAQFEAVSQGNLNVTATVFSEDEFGALATGFNQMARVILTTTSEAQRKAAEQEQAKEDLQRQVIRLLDDVEGAARGDLTVQAEVTADVLGAVADSFNLTIQNLREIVQQVTRAARQVTKGANDNESFARSLSSDALRQAEELAVTLNSVKVMTDSIQRVAESAREAEEVARTASTTALKGGEAVERTVAGILQIRETVAETTRKVKRLAESSQEISKIVAAISAIASRTNLLALNASIEAARAGEAGKGFAIVADEVRQLADRSAKSLREIEQIVLQIQSETSSVMTAMEEGVTQVIEGTKRAEQAKRALEDIIQVSNRIDALVRSITADTVEQTLTSRAVTQVMQSVELTAQETSQEAQRVSGSLQSLVSVARDLLTSVERFRIEAPDGK